MHAALLVYHNENIATAEGEDPDSRKGVCFSLPVSNSQREFEINQVSFLLLSVAYICKEEGNVHNFSNFILPKLNCILGPLSIMVLTDL